MYQVLPGRLRSSYKILIFLIIYHTPLCSDLWASVTPQSLVVSYPDLMYNVTKSFVLDNVTNQIAKNAG